MANFVLRVKTKSGQKVINGLLPTNTVYDLKVKLSEITGFNAAALNVFNGFPPKALDLENEDLSLNESGIISGDTLIVEEKQKCNDKIEFESQSHIVNSERLTSKPGMLMKKVVPADNSCLFTSIGYVLSGQVNPGCSSFMREIIASTVAADQDEYSEAFLNKPNNKYCEWILKSDSWGGAIELSILSKFYGLEIAVVNSVNGNINRFGENEHYAQRVFLIFDGIHYDPLYMESVESGRIQTIFPTDDDSVLVEATDLAKEANSSRQYTDVLKFTLKCMDCDVNLSGQLAASQHAKETGHTNFGEISA